MANKTTWHLMRSGKAALIALTFFGATSSCFGALASCAISTSTASPGVAIAAAGPGDDFASLNTAGGCFTSDVVFTNFSVTGSVASAGSYFSTLTNQSLTTGSEDVILSSVRGTDSTADGTNNDGSNNFLDAKGGGSTTFGSIYQLTSASKISEFSLNLLGVSIGTGTKAGSVNGTVTFCLGGKFTGTTVGTCDSGSVETLTLSSGTNIYDNILLTNGTQTGFSTIGVLNNFTLVGAKGASATDTYVTSFDESFDTPEPSTFALFLSALTGLAALRLRRRT